MEANHYNPETHEVFKSQPDIKYVLVEHEQKYAQKTVDELQDRDIVLFELITESEAHRHDLEQMINRITHDDGTNTDDVTDYLYDFNAEVVEALRGTGKEIKLIDVTMEDPEAAELDAITEQKMYGVFNAIATSSNLDVLRHHYLEGAYGLANEVQYRDQIVAPQIQEVIEQIKRDPEKPKLAVVQGSGHTDAFHRQANNRNIATSRTHIGSGTRNEQTYVYNYSTETVRRVIFSPDTPIETELVDRGLLELYADQLIGPSAGATSSREKIEELSHDKVLEALSTLGGLQISTVEGDADAKSYLRSFFAISDY